MWPMRRSAAAVGSIAWFAITAGAGIVWAPWAITGFHVAYESTAGRVLQLAGILLIGIGLIPIVATFAQFARTGGTPMPGVMTERLVVSGFNRYVRNPIYLGVLLIVVGEALLLGQPLLLVYAAAIWFGAAVFVRYYEEPALERRFGAAYENYRRAVPAWLPNRHGWKPPPP
jgi:protein-S-isoprenylcysteine O-methyltransferase Ste14